MLLMRPGESFVANKIVERIVEIYGNRHPTSSELVSRRNSLERVLCADIPDCTVRRGLKKSLSNGGGRTAAGLMLYEPRPVQRGERTLIGAYNYTIILKPSEAWMVTSIEPAATQAHLFQRIVERSNSKLPSLAHIQERLSDVWIPLMWMRSRRVLSGRGFIPHEFMTPWDNGLLFGKVEKIDDLPAWAANPLVYIVRAGSPQRYSPPDFYSEADKRVNAFTHTFVGSAELRPHQIILRDRLRDFTFSHQKVIEYLKLSWMIAVGYNNPFTEEITRIFQLEPPTESRLSRALSDIESIVDSDFWREEAAFSARNQRRYQTEAVTRSSSTF